MKVTFINEVADLCERVDADVVDVSRGIGLDPADRRPLPQSRAGLRRVVLPQGHAGADQARHRRRGRRSGWSRRWSTSTRSAWSRWRARSRTPAAGRCAGKRIAILGLTYKPKTDDMRDAPSLVIVPELQAAGATIVAYDPEGLRMAQAPAAGRGVRRERLRLHRGRGRGGDHHRMGRVPGARPRARQGVAEGADRRRPAQHLPDQGNEGLSASAMSASAAASAARAEPLRPDPARQAVRSARRRAGPRLILSPR